MEVEDIGRLALDAHVANEARLVAKKARRSALETHSCDCKGNDYGHANELCYQGDEPVEYWCENCQYVRPLHLAYRETAELTRKAKYRLTAAAKRYLK